MCDIKQEKDEMYITRLIVGYNRTTCNYDISTPTAELTTVKLLLNSVISTAKANFTTTDITHFYLNTDIPNYEYTRTPLIIFHRNIIDQYKL